MAMLEFVIRCRIPEDPNGTRILATDGVGGIKLPSSLVTQLTAIRQGIRTLKSYARITNQGEPNEEATIVAKFRICHHDEGEGHPPCEGEQEI